MAVGGGSPSHPLCGGRVRDNRCRSLFCADVFGHDVVQRKDERGAMSMSFRAMMVGCITCIVYAGVQSCT